MSFALLSISLLWLAGSQIARAQQTPDNGQPLPSYARPNNLQMIQGHITAINGQFDISLLDDNGYIDNIALHQGTIINPTGLTLAVGMAVRITGVNGGSAFDANQIDLQTGSPGAPQYSAPAPAPYYAPGSYYASAPCYGGGFAYPGYAYGYACGPNFGFYVGGAVVVGAPYYYGRPYYYRPYYYGRPYYGRPGYPYYGRPPYYGPARGYPSSGRPYDGSGSVHAPVAHSTNTHPR